MGTDWSSWVCLEISWSVGCFFQIPQNMKELRSIPSSPTLSLKLSLGAFFACEKVVFAHAQSVTQIDTELRAFVTQVIVLQALALQCCTATFYLMRMKAA